MSTSPLRILRILPTLGAGGTERQCLEVVDYILTAGLKTPAGRQPRIDLATIYGPPSAHTLPVPDGIRVTHLNLQRGTAGIMRAAGQLRRILEQYDCAHAMLWPAVWAASLARTAVPWVASLHGSQIRTDPLRAKLALDRLAFGRATRVVFNSQAGHDALAGPLALRPDRTEIIGNGKAPYSGSARQRHGLVCIARYLPPKRHDVLLDALARIEADKRPELRLYGLGTDSQGMHEEISRRRLDETVHALGETDVPLEAIAAALLVVLPSDHEGSPNAVLEAWAAGTLVLASAVSGISQLVRHGIDGWLVGNTPDEWAEAITHLLDRPKLAQKLADAGRRRVEAEFSMAKCAASWLRLYESVCAGA